MIRECQEEVLVQEDKEDRAQEDKMDQVQVQQELEDLRTQSHKKGQVHEHRNWRTSERRELPL